MVEALFNHSNKLQEVIIGLSSRKVQDDFHRYFSESSILIQSLGYEVNLSAIEKNYLQEVLSKNTRSQINRSNKILNELGDLVFRVVTDKNEIKYLYKDIAKIHIERWGNTAEGSGFTNDEFLTFHQQLLDKSDKNTVQIAVLSLNNSPIGYLVNFVYKQKAYFYLSALTSFDNNKIKVGLTLHEKTISYYREQGLKSYDFLAGEARYKDSLSSSQYTLSMNSFYRKSFVLIVERVLKEVKLKFNLLLSKYIG
jgi:CelD/BcsL family acetyltransferase involved in cellulose biosynthesis